MDLEKHSFVTLSQFHQAVVSCFSFDKCCPPLCNHCYVSWTFVAFKQTLSSFPLYLTKASWYPYQAVVYCFIQTLFPRFQPISPNCLVLFFSDLDASSFLAFFPCHQIVFSCFKFGHTLIPRFLSVSPNCLVLLQIWTHAHFCRALFEIWTHVRFCRVLFQIWTHAHSSLSAHVTRPSCPVPEALLQAVRDARKLGQLDTGSRPSRGL